MADAFICFYCKKNPSQGFHDVYPICSICETSIGSAPMTSDTERCCPNCKTPLPNSMVSCTACRYVDLELVEDEQPTEPIIPASPTWTCLCGYSQNDVSSERCANCNRSPFEEKIGLVRHISDFIHGKTSTQPWKCSGCGYEYNQENYCTICRNSKPAKISTPKVSSELWYCLNCNESNVWNEKYCVKCGCGQSWGEYLQFHNISVNLEEMIWTCPTCLAVNSLNECKCSNCNKTPKEMKKTAENKLSKALSWCTRFNPLR